MAENFLTPEDYISSLPLERQKIISKCHQVILENIPEGFETGINYGMIGYYVPHTKYPPGYHVDPNLPLPFINLASQKNYIALYHMGIYTQPQLLDWFKEEYPKYSSTKLDMGKSCIRFKKLNTIPYELIAKLVSKIKVEEWINIYEEQVKRTT